jgi:hypothetical protein
MNEKKMNLKDFKYVNNIDLSKENPKMKRELILFFACLISFPWVLYLILTYSSFFDSDLFGTILIFLIGIPFLIWGIRRILNFIIK